MKFWQIKNADDPEKALKVLKDDSSRDSYERSDNYNIFGVFTFFALRMRQGFLLPDLNGEDETPLVSTD